MQQGFAGSLLDASGLFARHVHRANVFGLQETFAMHRWCAEDFVFADSHGDVSVVGGSEAFVVKPSAHLAHILLDLVSIHVSRFSRCGMLVGWLVSLF